MKTYRELYIKNVVNKKEFTNKIKDYIPYDWSLEEVEIDMYEYLFFDYQGNDMPKVRVSIMLKDDATELQVGNIIPLDRNELTIEEYNESLVYFYKTVMQPFSKKFPQFEISSPSTDMFNPLSIISEKALEKLRIFHDTSNRSTGANHPEDKKRWFDFILQTVKDKKMFSYDELYRFLQDEDYWNGEQWNEEIASCLAEEYEQGCDLLEYRNGK